jgi:tetratricopeptide (TPR) repeat protein
VFYLTKKLGEWGTDLSLLSNFFIEPWVQPLKTLSASVQSWVINVAAFDLRALGRLSDAIAPMRTGAERRVQEKDWRNAAITYGNLSELHSTMGNLVEAVKAGRRCVEYADQSGDGGQGCEKRTTLAAALHNSGDLANALRWFQEGEQMLAKVRPHQPLLDSLWGFRYCDLLLDQGQPAEVLRRTAAILKIHDEQEDPISIGLDHLSLGRAHPLGSLDSRHLLDQAVAFLRRSGRLDILPLALLARATAHDLEEAFRIATRSGMRLHLADYHLIQARRLKSIAHFKRAEELIHATGYGRRKPALEELRKELNVE